MAKSLQLSVHIPEQGVNGRGEGGASGGDKGSGNVGGGEGGGEGGDKGSGGDDGETRRQPQSVQSVPNAQKLVSEPGPPSSQ